MNPFLKYLWHSLTSFWQPPVSLCQRLESSNSQERFSIPSILYLISCLTSSHQEVWSEVIPSGCSCSHASTSPLCSRTHVFHGCVHGYVVTWLPQRPLLQSSICQQEPVSRAPSKPSSEPEVQWRKFVLRACWCLLLRTSKTKDIVLKTVFLFSGIYQTKLEHLLMSIATI